MKVVYPKNIKKGLLAGMNFSIGPLNISITQLFILALGIALALVTFNAFGKAGSKALGMFLGIIIFIIFIIIAFFNISELTLIPFLAKLIRNYFFDTNRKFQINHNKDNPTDILIKEAKTKDEKQLITQKTDVLDKDVIKNIEKGGLI